MVSIQRLSEKVLSLLEAKSSSKIALAAHRSTIKAFAKVRCKLTQPLNEKAHLFLFREGNESPPLLMKKHCHLAPGSLPSLLGCRIYNLRRKKLASLRGGHSQAIMSLGRSLPPLPCCAFPTYVLRSTRAGHSSRLAACNAAV